MPPAAGEAVGAETHRIDVFDTDIFIDAKNDIRGTQGIRRLKRAVVAAGIRRAVIRIIAALIGVAAGQGELAGEVMLVGAADGVAGITVEAAGPVELVLKTGRDIGMHEALGERHAAVAAEFPAVIERDVFAGVVEGSVPVVLVARHIAAEFEELGLAFQRRIEAETKRRHPVLQLVARSGGDVVGILASYPGAKADIQITHLKCRGRKERGKDKNPRQTDNPFHAVSIKVCARYIEYLV